MEVDKHVCGAVKDWWVKRKSLIYGATPLTPVGIYLCFHDGHLWLNDKRINYTSQNHGL